MMGCRDEGEIIRRILNGDTRFFTVLVKKYERSLMRVLSRYFRDPEMARDVLQEAYLKAYLYLPNFEGRSSFKNWLFRIAVNTAKNKLRSFRLFDSIEDTVIGVPSFIERGIFHNQLLDYLKTAVENLPLKQKQTVELRVFEELSFKEVAEIMECPYDTAKANYRHAVMKIRDFFSKNEIYEVELEVV
ncbi:MAG: sigma-70 family RNA polymerase sigma factor [Bdellovibrionaceae bacterium]|nr:sigma-70 family RNA polymerase sigma factor [Pseudobdellovibrionaceae bacterium]